MEIVVFSWQFVLRSHFLNFPCAFGGHEGRYKFLDKCPFLASLAKTALTSVNSIEVPKVVRVFDDHTQVGSTFPNQWLSAQSPEYGRFIIGYVFSVDLTDASAEEPEPMKLQPALGHAT